MTNSKTRKKGQFQPGESGNPDGRPKGARNKITLLKQSLELSLREQAEPHMAGVLRTAIELAMQGDRQMIKLLLEQHMSKGATEEQKAAEKSEIHIHAVKEVEVSTVPVVTDSSKGETLQ